MMERARHDQPLRVALDDEAAPIAHLRVAPICAHHQARGELFSVGAAPQREFERFAGSNPCDCHAAANLSTRIGREAEQKLLHGGMVKVKKAVMTGSRLDEVAAFAGGFSVEGGCPANQVSTALHQRLVEAKRLCFGDTPRA